MGTSQLSRMLAMVQDKQARDQNANQKRETSYQQGKQIFMSTSDHSAHLQR